MFSYLDQSEENQLSDVAFLIAPDVQHEWFFNPPSPRTSGVDFLPTADPLHNISIVIKSRILKNHFTCTVCLGYSLEVPFQGASNEYQQHICFH